MIIPDKRVFKLHDYTFDLKYKQYQRVLVMPYQDSHLNLTKTFDGIPLYFPHHFSSAHVNHNYEHLAHNIDKH